MLFLKRGLPRERVIQVINHQKPDRIPIYGWLRANVGQQISETFGSVEAFEDRYEFDYAHIFGGPGSYPGNVIGQLRQDLGGEIDPKALRDVPMNDPNDTVAYQSIIDQVRHHKEQRGRFVYVQTPGIFEALNGIFGIENHLCYLVQFEDHLHHIYRRQAE